MFVRYSTHLHKSFLPLLFAMALVLAACSGTPTAGDTGAGQATPGDAGGAQTGGEPSTGETGQDTGGDAVTGLCANPFFPVVNGATWTYSATGGIEDFGFTNTITNAGADGFTLETAYTLEGNLHTSQGWACQADGLVALEYNGGPSAALSAEGLSVDYVTTANSGITIPANLAVGSSWSQTMQLEGDMTLAEGMTGTATGGVTYTANAVGTESVSTPAGTFDAIKVEMQQDFNVTASLSGVTVPLSFTGVTTVWYVSGVGMVKTVQTEDLMGTTTTVELQSYAIP